MKYDDTKNEKKLTKIFEKQLENKKYQDKIIQMLLAMRKKSKIRRNI